MPAVTEWVIPDRVIGGGAKVNAAHVQGADSLLQPVTDRIVMDIR